MLLNELKELNALGSLLFLGSGFSHDAANIRGGHIPIGNQLKEELASDLGVNPEDYDLKTISDEFGSRPALNLYQRLYQLFTVQKLSTDQDDILKKSWLRIYTTNYDDAVEFSYQQHRNSAPSYNYDEAKPRKLINGSIVHLHGAIRKTTEQNVRQQLVLNESSYVRQHFEKSPWYDDFVRDLRFCDACFFVGYCRCFGCNTPF